ncbi:MAG: hypothetical protein MJ162_06805 [Treponema sp.]|nr:hypothetical protein [Treponema sp.]
MKRLLSAVFLLFTIFSLFAQQTDGKIVPKIEYKQEPLKFNPWELIIYRPENNGEMNDIWCYLKLEDEEGNDVTKTAIEAVYEFPERNHFRYWVAPGDTWWVTLDTIPDTLYKYQKSFYLSGGMAMHMVIKPGKYKISFYSPEEKVKYFSACENKKQWNSNILEYDTEKSVRVIFVSPTANENGFYDGGWWVDYKAPKYFHFTIPHQN